MAGNSFLLQKDADGQVALWRQPAAVKLGNAARFLQEFASKQPLRIANAFRIENHSVPFDLHAFGERDLWAASKLQFLPLKTTFTVLETDNDKPLVPVFTPRAGSSLEMAWSVPSSMTLWFAVQISKDERFRYISASAMIFAISNMQSEGQPKYPGFFRLPLPNHFGDGRVCLGDRQSTFRSTDIPDIVAKTFRLFTTTVWNNDQLNAQIQERAAKLFRFSPSDNSTLAVPTTWPELCTKQSSPVMEEVVRGD